MPGALQGTFQGSDAAGTRQTVGFCVSGEERASSGISIMIPLVFGKLVLLASTFICLFFSDGCWWLGLCPADELCKEIVFQAHFVLTLLESEFSCTVLLQRI